MDVTPILAELVNEFRRENIRYICLKKEEIDDTEKNNYNSQRQTTKVKIEEAMNILLQDKNRSTRIQSIIINNELSKSLKEKLSCIEYLENKNYTEAEKLINKIVTNKPDSWELNAQLMLIKEVTKDCNGAIKYFNNAIKYAPTETSLRKKGAVLLSKYGKIDCAKNHYLRILEKTPEDYEALLLCGEMLSQTPNQKEAEAMLERYLIYAPKNNPQSGHLQAAVNLLIMSYTNAEIKKCNYMLNMIRIMVGKGYTKSITLEANRTFVRAFSRLIKLYLESLNRNQCLKEKIISGDELTLNRKERILHIGDSHCLAFAHQEIKINNKALTIAPIIIKGAKAWHYCQAENNEYKTALALHINQMTRNKPLLISFGEIDCRINEGILAYCRKYNQSIEKVTVATAKGYIKWVWKLLTSKNLKPYFVGVSAPSKDYQNRYTKKDEIARLTLIRKFNETMQRQCKNLKVNYIDIFDVTAGTDGYNNEKYMIDEYHLSPIALHKLKLGR